MRTLLAPLLVLALTAPARADEDESPSHGDSPRAVDKGTLCVGLSDNLPLSTIDAQDRTVDRRGNIEVG